MAALLPLTAAAALLLATPAHAVFDSCMQSCNGKLTAEIENGCSEAECMNAYMSGCMSDCMTEHKAEFEPDEVLAAEQAPDHGFDDWELDQEVRPALASHRPPQPLLTRCRAAPP